MQNDESGRIRIFIFLLCSSSETSTSISFRSKSGEIRDVLVQSTATEQWAVDVDRSPGVRVHPADFGTRRRDSRRLCCREPLNGILYRRVRRGIGNFFVKPNRHLRNRLLINVVHNFNVSNTYEYR